MPRSILYTKAHVYPSCCIGLSNCVRAEADQPLSCAPGLTVKGFLLFISAPSKESCCLVSKSWPIPSGSLSMGFSWQEYCSGRRSLLQEIFPTQGSNLHLLHDSQILDHWATPELPPSIGFYRQEYWSGLPFPSPGGSSRPRDWTQVSYISGRFHLQDTKCKSQSSSHGLMMSAQYCWPRGFSWWAEVKSKSMCLGSERSAQDHIHISAGIKWESPNCTYSWPSPSLQCLSYRLVTHFCLEMIMIKFHFTISSINCCGQLEIWMQKIEIGPLSYTT